MLLLLAACALPEPEDTAGPADTADSADTAPACAWDTPTERTLAWEEPCGTGVSAAETFGFAIGSFTGTLHWDDATESAFTLGTAPGPVTETAYGDPAECPLLLEVDASFDAATADARLAVAGTSTWAAESPAADEDLGGLDLSALLTAETLTLAPLDAASVRSLRGVLRTDGSLALVIRETWALDADTTRSCVRGALDVTSIGCSDQDDTSGTE